MKFLLVLCFVAAAWAQKNSSAPVAHSLFPGSPFHPVFPFFPGVQLPKPGTCPYVNHPPFHPRCVQCSSDYQCPYNQKCCWDGRCKTCMSPNIGNNNVCPNYAPRPLTGCRIECIRDNQCPSGKCCNYGCSSVCVSLLPTTAAPTTAAPPTAAPTTVAPTTVAPTTAAPTTAAPTTAAPTTVAPTTAAPTTAAPTTVAPTTAAPITPAQLLCPPGPSESFCRARCGYYYCQGPSCIHCTLRCTSSAMCPPGTICCRDAGCNWICTPPFSSG